MGITRNNNNNNNNNNDNNIDRSVKLRSDEPAHNLDGKPLIHSRYSKQPKPAVSGEIKLSK